MSFRHAIHKVHLTDKYLGSLKPERGKSKVIWDAGQPQMAIRVGTTLHRDAKGQQRTRISFFVVARQPGGKLIWSKLGLYDPERLKLKDARKIARDTVALVQDGKNPKELKREADRADARRRQDTVTAVVEDFLKKHVAKLRSAGAVESDMRRNLLGQKFDGENWVTDPKKTHHWRDRPITEITRRDIVELIEAIVDAGMPHAARILFAAIRKMFRWAIQRDAYGLELNPCDRIAITDLVGKLGSRDRVLEDAELRLIWQAAGRVGKPFGPYFKALMLSGQRRGEIACLSRPEINRAEKMIVFPPERMKNGQTHILPLTDYMLDLIDDMPVYSGQDNGFIFSTTGGKRPISGFGKAKEALQKAVHEIIEAAKASGEDLGSLGEWRVHDLRRTVRTNLAKLGILGEVAERVLAHKQSGISAVYNRHDYVTEKRAALEAWERALLEIVGEKPTNQNVADLGKERAKRRELVEA